MGIFFYTWKLFKKKVSQRVETIVSKVRAAESPLLGASMGILLWNKSEGGIPQLLKSITSGYFVYGVDRMLANRKIVLFKAHKNNDKKHNNYVSSRMPRLFISIFLGLGIAYLVFEGFKYLVKKLKSSVNFGRKGQDK